MGHSAGAYNAAMLALDPQWLRAAKSDPSIIRGVAGLAGPYDFLPLEKGGRAEKAMGKVRPIERTQPIHFVRGDELGRASCRERVCQYVVISVFAVSLKTKTNKKRK